MTLIESIKWLEQQVELLKEKNADPLKVEVYEKWCFWLDELFRMKLCWSETYHEIALSEKKVFTKEELVKLFKEQENDWKLEIEAYAEKQITDKEIEKYYDEEVVGDIKVSHILITPAVTDDMTDEDKTTAETEAKAKITSIINELNSTKAADIETKFAELAKTHSEDETTKETGGSLGYINKDTLSDDYKELVTQAYKLKDGKYTTSVVTTELGYHVVLRLDTKEKAKLKDVKEDIVSKLAEQYLTENPVASVKALQEMRKENDVTITDDELQEKYATYIQNQLNYYTQENEK